MGVDPGSLLLHFSRNGDFRDGGGDLLVLERGEGPYVFDVEGRRYLDGLSSLFCCQLGYSYGEEFGAAAAGQLARLCFNTNWGTAHPAALELAEQLAARSPWGSGRVFFTSGGSESVETAWKLARQYHAARGEGGRRKAIARVGAYHGVSLGALSLTGVPSFKEQFGPPAIETRHVANTNAYRDERDEAERCRDLLDELEAAIEEEGSETVALIVAEPVQNAGGCFVPPPGYWPGLREIADRHGALLLADEVITGMGRLGEWFGVSRFGTAPDLITLAKGLTSAYAPMGAVLASERVAEPLYEPGRGLMHGVTFGGHPLCAAVALLNLEIFERDGVLENVRALEPHLRGRMEELLELPIVGDVRGAGFFWAAELVKEDGDGRFDAEERERLLRGFLPARLREAGLIARADDRGDAVVQIAPPLICDREQLDEAVEALAAALADAGEFMAVGTSGAATR
jgi:adenosylmethionine-8-amino-7-oxononanoate aminotransferase